MYTGKDTSGKELKMIASNRNSLFYAEADNNNKYIPYFISDFMTGKKLTAWDYNYFFQLHLHRL